LILALAAASDVLDGWLARRRAEATPTGGLLDAVMDKVFVLVVVLSLVGRGLLSPIEVLLLGARDLGELPLVVYLGLRRRLGTRAPRGANAGGKLATVLQFLVVAVAILELPYRGVWIGVAGGAGLVAAVGYWVREVGGERESGGAGG
jgi:phosphatidylglycerophosphate synthase